ncbi:Glycerol-3-phosphate phosphatase [Hondaea fermentalgiana]|uniref:Glycerol-3-phosphate phosphatase n=1 Tax=Hondaea fermentalgiana TaxID=2315210 RepID=A0A2R5G460_9STRA|nr:Glycerol-3-phosphate phosphatase [Hondaea fermentalgiana]|eukprot:GBG25780.1 Glycerol-3-phosphate phosphatase [Hondaea fermentalgiana]
MGGRKLLDVYKNFVLDCDGVLWHSATAIAGSVEAVSRMRAAGKRVVFVTNNSTKSRQAYLDKFEALKFEGVEVEHINTSGSAAAELCKLGGHKKVFAIGEPGLMEEFKAVGVETVEVSSDAKTGMDEAEFENAKLEEGVSAVVVGWDRNFSFRKLCLASLYIQAGAKLIATGLDPSDKVGGKSMPGNGCNVNAIQYSVDDPQGEHTTVAGKPNSHLMENILNKYNFTGSETLMVGDRLDTDIKFAEGQAKSLLVLSGCTPIEEYESRTDVKPTHVAADLATALDMEI